MWQVPKLCSVSSCSMRFKAQSVCVRGSLDELSGERKITLEKGDIRKVYYSNCHKNVSRNGNYYEVQPL